MTDDKDERQSPPPKPPAAPATPFWHIPLSDPEAVARLKAEFAAKMTESGKKWPRKRAKRKPDGTRR
jgi:hypothetical protein